MLDLSINSAFDPDNPIRRQYDASIQAAQGGSFDNDHKRMRYYVLHQLVQRAAANLPSLNVAECGCWHGHSTHITASILNRPAFLGQLAVFDSFEGLSEFQPPDLSAYSASEEVRSRHRKHFVSDPAAVKAMLAGFPFVQIFPGWIPDRFREVAPWEFSHVSIDVDLYQPTLTSLEFFYPRLAFGGSIYVDDYGYKDFPGAKVAVDAFLQGRSPTLFVELPYGSALIIK